MGRKVAGNPPIEGHPTNFSVIDVLITALDPANLSVEHFNLEKYLKTVLEAVGKSFHVPHIIVRYEDPIDRERLRFLAGYGVPSKEEIEANTDATKNRRLAAYIANSKKSYYIHDIAADGLFEQRSYYNGKGFHSALACPIFSDGEFVGLTMFFKEELNGFLPEEIDFLEKRMAEIIVNAVFTAKRFDRFRTGWLQLLNDHNLTLNSLRLTSHDARALLMGSIQLLEHLATRIPMLESKNLHAEEKTMKYIALLRGNLSRAATILLTGLEADSKEISHVNIEDVAASSIQTLEFLLHDVEIVFERAAEGARCLVKANPSDLRAVFRNLLMNAHQAIVEAREEGIMGGPGRITIRVRAEPSKISVDIADNGIGMDEARTLQPANFHEGESHWRQREGTGIGLALCMRILQRYQGSMTFVSMKHAGTTFTVSLSTAT